MRQPGAVWMDSGAYTAFTQGEVIDLKAYCAWLRVNAKYIDHYAVLDVITSADATWQAQRAMEKEGLAPVPTFHYGEDPRWLSKYLDAGYQYLALGGMVPVDTKDLIPWLDDLWTHYLCNARGEPRLRVHGFGMTIVDLMCRYPWFSVDSSSEVLYAGYGMVSVLVGGKIVRPFISTASPRSNDAGQHFQTFPPAAQEAIRAAITSAGSTVDEVANDYYKRHHVCIKTMQRFEMEGWRAKPWARRSFGLFSAAHPEPGQHAHAEKWPWPRLEIYHAGGAAQKAERELLTKLAPRRMYSYHQMRKSTKLWDIVKEVLGERT